MLFELSIFPTDNGHSMGKETKDVFDMIERSGVSFRMVPYGMSLEGEWDQIMPLIRRCHELVRRSHANVMTLVKINDQSAVKPHFINDPALVSKEKLAEKVSV